MKLKPQILPKRFDSLGFIQIQDAVSPQSPNFPVGLHGAMDPSQSVESGIRFPVSHDLVGFTWIRFDISVFRFASPTPP